MSDPLSDVCAYCGSPDVLDDAWFCDARACYAASQFEAKAQVLEGKLQAVEAALMEGRAQ